MNPRSTQSTARVVDAGPAGRALPWTSVVTTEVTKLATTRVVPGLLLAQAAMVALAVTGVMLASGVTTADLATDRGVRLVLEHPGLATVFSLVIGVIATGGEYKAGTITDTFLSEPRRGRVLGAKLLVQAGVGTVGGLISAGVALAAMVIWMGVRDVPFDPTSATVARSLAGLVAWNACYAMIGVALGAILRTVTGAIVLALVWAGIVEGALAALAPELGRWLPATAALALGYGSADTLLPQVGAGLVLLGYTAVLATAAVLVTRRRDVL